MKTKLICASVAAVLAIWALPSSARESIALTPAGTPVGTEGVLNGVDTTGPGTLLIGNQNINTNNDLGGAITSNANATAILNFTGSSNVNGFTGTSGIKMLRIDAGANASTVNFNGDVFSQTLRVIGTGNVNLNGNLIAAPEFSNDGFINLAANKSITGAITTLTANTGTLTLNGGSIVTGAIGGASGIKQINVVGGNASITGAVQTLGLSLGTNTLNITGALTTNPGATISTTIASNLVYGKVIASTSLISAAGITVIPTVTGALTNGTNFRIVDAPAGTNAAPVSVINNNPRYTFAGVPTTTGDVNILLTGINPLATLTTNPGALAVAPILDINAQPNSDLLVIQNAIAILPDAASINNALAQLAPNAANLAAPWVAGQTTRLFDDLWMARVDEIQDQCCEVCKPGTPTDAHKCKTPDERGTWWAKAFDNRGNQENFNNMYGYDTKAYGLMVAFDKLITDETRLGFGGGYANTKIDGNNSSGHNEIDSYQLTAYLNHSMGDAFIQGALTAGIDRYDGQRSIVFTGINRRANANFQGQQYTAIATVGKHFSFGTQGTITPLASLQVSRIQVDSYNEKGAGDANLRVSSQDYNFVQSSLGFKAERVFQSGNNSYSPEAHFKWLHDFSSTTMEQQAAFTGSATKFKTSGIDQDRDLFNIGAGFTFLSCKCDDKSWSLKALYDYKWNESGYSSNQVSAMASLKF